MKVFSALVTVVASSEPSYEEWAAQYGFNAADDVMEAKYDANVAQYDEWNADPAQGATFGVNQFSGMTFEEFEAQYLTAKPSVETDMPILDELAPADNFVATASDWDVTPVKDQGSCGSCWAFGTLGGIEAVHKQKTLYTVNLAEQQLVDCSTQNHGCTGGRPDRAINYLAGKPIYTESSYPYTARDGTCTSGTSSGVTVGGYSRVTKSESGLLSSLDSSAVTVTVQADSKFQGYKSGILTGVATSCSLNHAVLATGYGSNFLKIKNSWGSGWGEGGYIRVERTTSGCGPFGIWYDNPVVPTSVNWLSLDLCVEIGCGNRQRGASCQCDSDCPTIGNCCSDFETRCNEATLV